ncbi:MAG: peptide ligase PGM1-related protein [Candidatus Nanopelagicales bacterium]
MSRHSEFEAIEAALPDMVRAFEADPHAAYCLVVVPSMSFDQQLLRNVLGVEHYEERLLAMLLQLHGPRMHVVFCSSAAIPDVIVDYYLDLIPGVPVSHSRPRLTMISCDDLSRRPLTEKLLERPPRLREIKAVLASCRLGGIVAMNTTDLERELAVELGIPLLGNPPELDHLGTKSGSRDMFRAAGIDLAAGYEHLHSMAEVAHALAELKRERPHLHTAVVKLEEGFSGEGNALYRYEHGSDEVTILAGLPGFLKFQGPAETYESFSERFEVMGGIVEEFIDGVESSPSAQGYIGPDGTLRALSTHDQVLGGADGQVFEGSTFPADERYRLRVQEAMMRVGAVLQAKGARGRFAVDFVEAGDRLCAIEINLRKGGTTHPMLTLAVITEGRYDPASGLFTSGQGVQKSYYATDNLQSPHYRGIAVPELLDAAVEERLLFDPVTERGCVFHMLGALSEYGKVGVTCIADTLTQAQDDYRAMVDMMDRLGAD